MQLELEGLFVIFVLANHCGITKAMPSNFPDINDRITHFEHQDLIREEDIIELPMGRFPEPICEYSVHWRNSRGQKVYWSLQLGDPIYHKYSCYYPGRSSSDLYCISVQNCTVTSNQRSVQIIDDYGCTKFPSILPSVHYPSDLEAGIQANAFALDIDQPSVLFNCNIRLLIKEGDRCRRTICPPTPQ